MLPAFADEARLSVELVSNEPKTQNEHVEIARTYHFSEPLALEERGYGLVVSAWPTLTISTPQEARRERLLRRQAGLATTSPRTMHLTERSTSICFVCS